MFFTASTYKSADPQNAEQLGEKLFFDPILSLDSTISCASCHKPEFAFADTLPFSFGVKNQLTDRNTPTAMNLASRPYFFYDGRAATLAEQALFPIRNPKEMGLPVSVAVARLRQHPQYARWFNDIFHSQPDSTLLGEALAAFERTLETSDTPHDVWLLTGKPVLSESQIRGRDLFLNKGKCFDCHFSPDFTGDEFRNIGTYNGKELNDVGRFSQTHDSTDLGRFKVPGLRNIAITGPYMHNGMFKTLREVIEYYNKPEEFIPDPINIDTLLQKPLYLTFDEMNDLENYLNALTDARFKR